MTNDLDEITEHLNRLLHTNHTYEQRIAAARLHIDRARLHANAETLAELVTALDVLGGGTGA